MHGRNPEQRPQKLSGYSRSMRSGPSVHHPNIGSSVIQAAGRGDESLSHQLVASSARSVSCSQPPDVRSNLSLALDAKSPECCCHT